METGRRGQEAIRNAHDFALMRRPFGPCPTEGALTPSSTPIHMYVCAGGANPEAMWPVLEDYVRKHDVQSLRRTLSMGVLRPRDVQRAHELRARLLAEAQASIAEMGEALGHGLAGSGGAAGLQQRPSKRGRH